MEIELFAIGVAGAMLGLASMGLSFLGRLVPLLESRVVQVSLAAVGLGLVALSHVLDERPAPSVTEAASHGSSDGPPPLGGLGRLPVIATTPEGAPSDPAGRSGAPPLEEKFLIGSLSPVHPPARSDSEGP